MNLGQDRMVTVNELADMIAAIAGTAIRKVRVPGPQGCVSATPITQSYV
jgi:nucleoside-diphosphate-sugar epimerase